MSSTFTSPGSKGKISKKKRSQKGIVFLLVIKSYFDPFNNSPIWFLSKVCLTVKNWYTLEYMEGVFQLSTKNS